MSNVMMLLGGLFLLVVGGELLVRGAVAVAERFGMSPLLIGLTLVGFGTSMPELVTSVQASLANSPGIAVGNIVGSSIANILLILGLSAIITPISVNSGALKRDGAIVLFSAILLGVVGHFLALDRLVGFAFVCLLAAYLVFVFKQETLGSELGHSAAVEKAGAYDQLHEGPINHQAAAKRWAERIGPVIPLVMALGGLAIVVLGGKVLVDAATLIARGAGISETVIGLTIVAVGTSMPEFVTSVVAALRNQSDVALGNIMGSNIYNILGIGGVTGLIAPTPIPDEIVRFDNVVMIGASLALLVFARSGLRIGRVEGAVLLACYGAYVLALWPK